MLHPFEPFITEEIFTSIQSEEETIMLSKWPEFTSEFDFEEDEKAIELMKEEKGVYQLPTDICTYTANTGIPITEAVAIIAITRFEQKPLPIDYRELNIHVW